jgi:hypothetical protein
MGSDPIRRLYAAPSHPLPEAAFVCGTKSSVGSDSSRRLYAAPSHTGVPHERLSTPPGRAIGPSRGAPVEGREDFEFLTVLSFVVRVERCWNPAFDEVS